MTYHWLEDDIIEGCVPLGEQGRSGPGKKDRKGIGMIEAITNFSNTEYASRWIEGVRWEGTPIICPKCDSDNTSRVSHPTMPYRCKACRKHFSVKTGTPMGESKLPVTSWLIAAYLDLTNLKGVSSLKMSRDLKVKQDTAWHLQHRLREAFMTDEPPAEFATGKEFAIDEAYIGGLEPNKHAIDKIPGGQGGSTKQIVIGITEKESGKIWVDVIPDTRGETVADVVNRILPEGATVYTDEGKHYGGVEGDRHAVNHGIGEYVRAVDLADGMKAKASTNHTESAWSMLKRAIVGVHHKMSPKHLRRYVKAFAGRWNIRSLDTEDQMKFVFRGMLGRDLAYADLTAENGLPSGSGSDGAYYPERRRRYRERAEKASRMGMTPEDFERESNRTHDDLDGDFVPF